MKGNEAIKKHFSYLSTDQVAEICVPLFEQFSFNYFGYARIYSDNSALMLVSSRAWLDYYAVQNNYPFLITAKEGVYSWATNTCSKAISDGVSYFNLHNGVVIEKPHKDFIEVIEFTSSDQHIHPMEFCCNRKDLLNQFLFYFKEQAKTLIAQVDKNRLLLPISNQPSLQQSYTDFCESIKTKKNRMNFYDQEIIFSKREFEVLSLLAQSQTIKHVARSLHISPRTVETYLQSAKNKTRYYTTLQLIDDFKESLF